MSALPSYISTSAAALCLVLGIRLLSLSLGSQGLQREIQALQEKTQGQQKILQDQQRQLQTQQEQINAGTTISQQVGPALLRDMAVVSTTNGKMKALLAKYGYNVKFNASDPKSSTTAPAPSRP